jgi:galactokinase
MLQQAWGTDLDDMTLALAGQEAEHRFAGVRCGLLDQVTSLFSQEHRAVFFDCRSRHVERVPVPDEARFVILPTGVKHALADGAYNARRAECEEAAKILGVGKLRDADEASVAAAAREGRLAGAPLRRAQHVTGENARVLGAVEALRKGDLAAVGRLMNASHESSRTLFENSCEELDDLSARARELPGCRGARLTGGGFGGAVLALVDAASLEDFLARLPRGLAAEPGTAPRFLVSTAAG